MILINSLFIINFLNSYLKLKMPRRLPVRPAKLIGNLFVLFVLLVIGFVYYTYVVVLWGPKAVSKNVELKNCR